MSSTAATDLTITLVQTNLQWQDAAANLDILDKLLNAETPNTDLIILPEMFTSAFTMDSGAIAETWPGPTLEWLQARAAAFNAAITGSIAVTDRGKRYNRMVFVKPDGETICYDKKHLFRMLNEHKRYSAGTEKILVQWRGWKILPLVCYDLRFPVWCRYTPEYDYDLMLFVANWPAPRNQHWRTLLQARAIENLAYVAGVNRVGSDGNKLSYVGHSAVISATGEELLQAGELAGTHTVTLSKATLDTYRQQFPAWMDADKFEVL